MKELAKDRRGISPIITTVILVGVGIAIAIAVSLWMSSLATTFTRFERLEIISAYAIAERPSGASQEKPSVTIIRALINPTATFLESLAGYKYRRPITIDNTKNPNSLANYQVLVTLDTASLISAGKIRSDCGDIRFTDSDGSTLLNYWIESGVNTASTRIWVKVPSIPASSTKTIYIYYGNPTATSISSGKSVFIIYDDFNDLSQWIQYKGSACTGISIDTTTFGYPVLKISVSGGTASSSTWGIVYNKTVQLPSSFKVDVDVYTNNIADTLPYFNALSGPFYVMRFDARSNYYDLIGYYASGASTTTELARAARTPANTWFHQQVIRYSNGNWELRKGGDLATLGTLEASYTHTATTSGGFGLTGDGATGVTYFKSLRIRQYTSPEPKAVVGNEQTEPGAPQNLKAILSNGKIVLQWSPPVDNGGLPITGYKIYRSTTPGGEAYLTTVGNVTSYEDSNIVNGITYYYKVSAINEMGEGSASSEVSISSTPSGAGWRVYITVKNTGSADATVTMIMINGIPTQSISGITSWNIKVDTNSFSSSADPANTPVPIPVGATATFQFGLLQNTQIGNGKVISGITLNIVLHSAAGKDYPASVSLP
ncbi:MAG: DUF2341 domain-containing protein [Thermoproteota archaeon]